MKLVAIYSSTEEYCSGCTHVVPIEYESANKFLEDFYFKLSDSGLFQFNLCGYTWNKFDFIEQDGSFELPVILTIDEWFE